MIGGFTKAYRKSRIVRSLHAGGDEWWRKFVDMMPLLRGSENVCIISVSGL